MADDNTTVDQGQDPGIEVPDVGNIVIPPVDQQEPYPGITFDQAQQQFNDLVATGAPTGQQAAYLSLAVSNGSLSYADAQKIIGDNNDLSAEFNAQLDDEVGPTTQPENPVPQQSSNVANIASGVISGLFGNVKLNNGSQLNIGGSTAVGQAVSTPITIVTSPSPVSGVQTTLTGTTVSTGNTSVPINTGSGTTSNPSNSNSGVPSKTNAAKQQASLQNSTNYQQGNDWRVKLMLAPNTPPILYKAKVPGILGPLARTQGVIFPYTPVVQVRYGANYESLSPTHSNYKIYNYQSSSVDEITIGCDFTAQDNAEAEYLLAVIHFFRTVTKMFYGQDSKPGVPPPLCYLYGLGAFQFNNHPLVITNFNYSLPNDVDYIRAGTQTVNPGVSSSALANAPALSQQRLGNTVTQGGSVPPPDFGIPPIGTVSPTYVPTMMQLQISAYPIVSRNDISNNFSVKDYATGNLLSKGYW